jgi:redox-sensitive bicupin YhaK (pirin superfamily)
MTNVVIHRAETRGTSNQGWLHSRHSFSFGDFYDPNRLHFGALRVLNDEMLAPGKGYGTHPHSNIEIITIPLEGELEYKDELNNKAIIGPGDIQALSAGTGIFHRETNVSKDNSVRYINIWILPQLQKLKPRYSYTSYKLTDNEFTEILSSDLHQNKVWIYQDVWLNMGKITDTDTALHYKLKRAKGTGVYVFVIEGTICYENEELAQRDGMAVSNVSEMTFTAKSPARFLVIEVPLKI